MTNRWITTVMNRQCIGMLSIIPKKLMKPIWRQTTSKMESQNTISISRCSQTSTIRIFMTMPPTTWFNMALQWVTFLAWHLDNYMALTSLPLLLHNSKVNTATKRSRIILLSLEQEAITTTIQSTRSKTWRRSFAVEVAKTRKASRCLRRSRKNFHWESGLCSMKTSLQEERSNNISIANSLLSISYQRKMKVANSMFTSSVMAPMPI